MVVLAWIGVAAAGYLAIGFCLFSWWSIQAKGIEQYFIDLGTSRGWSDAWVISRWWALVLFIVFLAVIGVFDDCCAD